MAFNIPFGLSFVDFLVFAFALVKLLFVIVIVTLWLMRRLLRLMERADSTLSRGKPVVEGVDRLEEQGTIQADSGDERAQLANQLAQHRVRVSQLRGEVNQWVDHVNRLRDQNEWFRQRRSERRREVENLLARNEVLRLRAAALVSPGCPDLITHQEAEHGSIPSKTQSPVHDEQLPPRFQQFQGYLPLVIYRHQNDQEAAERPSAGSWLVQQATRQALRSESRQASTPELPQGPQLESHVTASYVTGVSAGPSNQPLRRRGEDPQHAHDESAPEGHGKNVSPDANTEHGGVVPAEEDAARLGRMVSGYTSGSLLMGSDDKGRFAYAEEDE